MSASREKKQRQGTGPSEKALQAQQQQADRKRKTITYTIIGVVIAVLVAALLIWNSGFFQARASAATLGDETLTAAELSYYYHDVRLYTAQLAAYGMGSFDSSKADDEQIYNETDGQTYRDYFMDAALQSAQQDKALAEEAVKLGHAESEVKENLDAYVDSIKSQASQGGYTYGSYLRLMYGPYMNADTFEKLYTRSLMASLARNDKSDELFNSYTQSDLDAYYGEHKDELDTIEYSSLYFPAATVETKDADGNDLPEDEVNKLKEKAKADAKKKAEEALKAVEDGSTFQSQIDKYELSGANNSDHTKSVGTSTVNATFRDQLLKLDKDACELVETDNGCFVISFHDRYLDDTPTRDVRHILARAESTTGEDNKLVAPTDEAWAAAKEKIEAIQAEWEAGGKTEDAFAKLANEKSDDGDGTTGGLYERIAENSSYVPEFLDWIYPAEGARTPGDAGLVQHSASEGATSGYYGYHLIYYVGENEPVWMGTVRSTKASEDQQTWLEELSANYPTALTNGANYLGR